MRRAAQDVYQSPDGLERAIVDLVRVGSRGHGAGVRQLATRLIRSVPPAIANPEEFREALHEALVQAADSVGLRLSPSNLPTEADSAHPLVHLDLMPNGQGLVLPTEVMAQLDEVVSEHHHADKLRTSGLRLSSTLLLSGPPGVGKTMAARWLASALGLPLVSMDLSSVVSSYLGTSGRNIKAVIDYGRSAPCVLLLDEFDAIAKRRDDEGDIGELKRIVNVILVELDSWPDTSVLVAATNHAQLLDPAVGRRFDRILHVPLPTIREREAMLRHLWEGQPGINDDLFSLFADLSEGLSGSDLTRLWETAARRALIHSTASGDELLKELAIRGCVQPRRRDQVMRALSERLHLSNRQIGELVGVSHPTVAAGIKRARRLT